MIAINVQTHHSGGKGFDVTGQLDISGDAYATGGLTGVKAAILAKVPSIVGVVDFLIVSGDDAYRPHYNAESDKLFLDTYSGTQVTNAATIAATTYISFFAKVR